MDFRKPTVGMGKKWNTLEMIRNIFGDQVDPNGTSRDLSNPWISLYLCVSLDMSRFFRNFKKLQILRFLNLKETIMP